MKDFIFTSEAVLPGHPDKICDLIADTILDEALKLDPQAQMAVEASIKGNEVYVFGEATLDGELEYDQIALGVLKDLGYYSKFKVIVNVSEQSKEINSAVVGDGKLAAGDQGIVFGYATNETPTYMPAPIYYANLIAKALWEESKKIAAEIEDYEKGGWVYDPFCDKFYDSDTPSIFKGDPIWAIGPDGKVQVSVKYKDNVPECIDTVTVSIQNNPLCQYRYLRGVSTECVVKHVVTNCLPISMIGAEVLINPSGSFIHGGPKADSGTTGRKIVCDSYGGMSRVGGGCFSSKSPTKVDRSGAYYARYVAKNIVANGLADRCEIQVSYVIGRDAPFSYCIETFGTNHIPEEDIKDVIDCYFDFSVSNIIKELDLLKPIYTKTTNFGHFGKEDLPWEKVIKLDLDKLNKINEAIKTFEDIIEETERDKFLHTWGRVAISNHVFKQGSTLDELFKTEKDLEIREETLKAIIEIFKKYKKSIK